MCGRFALYYALGELLQRYGLNLPQFSLSARYNIAPMQPSPVVAVVDDKKNLGYMRWGLVPAWAKDEKMAARMINARSETVAEKPSFRKPFKSQRCLVPATGYYEWKELPESRPTKKVKVPMYFTINDGELFSFAGLWDRWQRFDGKEVISFTIITTEPNDLSAPIHNRMPVILNQEDEESWLDPTNEDTEQLTAMLRPYDSDKMSVYPVSKFVNSPRNDSPKCIEKLPG